MSRISKALSSITSTTWSHMTASIEQVEEASGSVDIHKNLTTKYNPWLSESDSKKMWDELVDVTIGMRYMGTCMIYCNLERN